MNVRISACVFDEWNEVLDIIFTHSTLHDSVLASFQSIYVWGWLQSWTYQKIYSTDNYIRVISIPLRRGILNLYQGWRPIFSGRYSKIRCAGIKCAPDDCFSAVARYKLVPLRIVRPVQLIWLLFFLNSNYKSNIWVTSAKV